MHDHTDSCRVPKLSASWWAIKCIRAYQLMLSPWLGGQCRFFPTCSNYAQAAIAEHGVLQGSWLGLKRIGRCHPFHEGGVDPVPAHSSRRQSLNTRLPLPRS